MAISIQTSLRCCGISEITGLNTYKSATTAMSTLCRVNWNNYDKRLNDFGTFLVFSTVDKMAGDDSPFAWCLTIGEDFADLIRDHHLGPLKDCGRRINRNSDNTVHMWTWQPNMEALGKWYSVAKKRIKKRD